MFTRNLPIFLVFGAAFLIGVGVLIAWAVEGDDDGPVSALSDFEAAQAAKIAYFGSDNTVADAVCLTEDWDRETDVWQVECTIEREGGSVERTQWRVTADGTATRADGGPASPTAEA
jgi:hypothetical protein